MKAKIKGIEIEGDSSEILELINNIDSIKPVKAIEPEPEPTINKPYCPKRRRSTLDIMNLANEAAKMYVSHKGNFSIARCCKNKFGYTEGHVNRLVRKRVTELTNTPSLEKPNHEDSLRVKRGRFIFSRSNFLMGQQNMSREKAMGQAAAEWKHSKLPSVDITPIIIRDPIKNKILLDILGNVINVQYRMRFVTDSSCLGISSVAEWVHLLADIIGKSPEILTFYKSNGHLFSENGELAYKGLIPVEAQ